MTREKAARVALYVLSLCMCIPASSGQQLVRQWQKKILSKTVGAPYAGVIPPSIWAVAFSPDGKYLAVGIGIVESRSAPYKDFKSYVGVIAIDQPDAPMRTFEVSAKPWGNGPRFAWSPDGKYIAIDHVSLLFDADILEIETGHQHLIPRDNCNVIGVVSGPRLVMGCFFVKRVIRLVNLSGAIESELPVAGSTVNAGFAVAPGLVALAVDPNRGTGANPYNEFELIEAVNYVEVKRWSFTERFGWSGALSVDGSVFCNLFYDNGRPDGRKLTCRDVPSGREIGSVPIQLKGGRTGVPLAVGGSSRVTVDEGTFVPAYRSVWDVRDGRLLARWPVRTQKVLPKPSWPAEFLNSTAVYPYAISPDGMTIAEGGSGLLTVYKLPQ